MDATVNVLPALADDTAISIRVLGAFHPSSAAAADGSVVLLNPTAEPRGAPSDGTTISSPARPTKDMVSAQPPPLASAFALEIVTPAENRKPLASTTTPSKPL